MKFHVSDKIRLILPKAALTTVFEECDGFDQDETGGRVIGTFEEERGKLVIRVNGIIEAGPQARRSAVTFFQDGVHQEQVFRKIESHFPQIEHLGNWHTHHVNGLQHLSGGDIETYHRTVNHRNHNTPFFYALLVTEKHQSADPLGRYTVKHYVFQRGEERIFELRRNQVQIVDEALLWPTTNQHVPTKPKDDPNARGLGANPDRAYDKDILTEFYRGIRPFSSVKLGMYWRGPLELLDGRTVEVVLLEDSAASKPTYSVTVREAPVTLKAIIEELASVEFPSARAALITTERSCNRAIFRSHRELHRVDSSA